MARVQIHVTTVNGDEYDVRTTYADTVAYEAVARRHKWGSISENPLTAQGFVCWRALTRERLIDKPYEEWIDTVADITVPQDDDTDPLVGPTRPAPTAG